MSILLAATDRDLTKLKIRLNERLSDVVIQVWPDIPHPEIVEFAVLWKHPSDLLATLPNLKAINSLGAGVDFIVSDKSVKDNISVSRIVDDSLSGQMAEYVLSMVLAHKCRHLHYAINQQNKQWQPKRRVTGNNVAIMGLGKIGTVVANSLNTNGFEVKGWSKRAKTDPDIHCVSGSDGFEQLLTWADVIVSILPNTNETKEIFNQSAFSKMKDSAFFINVGRGELVDEQALFASLNNNTIAGACLDVFQQEPLNPESNLWQTPGLILTPHISAITDTRTVINQLITNYENVKVGKSMVNCIDRELGY